MWSLVVVVIDVFDEHPMQMSAALDEHPVQTFGSNGAHESFRKRVGARSPDRSEDHLRAFAAEHVVEASRELRVPVTYQKPHRLLRFRAPR